jgi:hypothetical protein
MFDNLEEKTNKNIAHMFRNSGVADDIRNDRHSIFSDPGIADQTVGTPLKKAEFWLF